MTGPRLLKFVRRQPFVSESYIGRSDTSVYSPDRPAAKGGFVGRQKEGNVRHVLGLAHSPEWVELRQTF